MDRQKFIATGVPDLLDLIPALFGFAPRESFIAIVTHGESRRFGFRLRLDLPPLHHVGAAAEQVVGHIERQEADGVILIALTDRFELADVLMAAVRSRLGAIPVHEAVCSDGASYRTYGPEGPGESVAYVRRCSPVVVEAVVDGMQILPDREDLVARFAEVSGIRKAAMEEATARALGTTLHELSAGPRTHLGAAGIRKLQPIIAKHAAGRPLNDDDRAVLALWVSSRDVRDSVWSRLSRANAETALELWTEVAQSVVEPFEAPVLCLAAFAAWLSGDGAQALIAVERALAKEPKYEMGLLIMQILEAGLSPERWDGFDPEPPAIAA